MSLELLPFQHAGRDFLVERPRAFLLDSVGLGKTVMAIAAHQILQNKLIVFPESNKVYDWSWEYAQWAPEVKRYIVQGSKIIRNGIYDSFSKADPPAVLIVNHHKVFPDLDKLLNVNVDGAIIDESEVFNNHQTNIHLHMHWVIRRLQVVWQLSAYPFGINLLQFYNLFAMVGINIFGERRDFIERFCIVQRRRFRVKGGRFIKKTEIVGAKNLDEFKRLAAPFCLRRTKKSVGIELPPVRFQAITCELSKRQRQLYDLAKKNKIDTMTRKEKFEPLSRYVFFTQIMDSPWLLDSAEKPESPKLDEVVKLFRRIQDKVVVYTQFKKWFPIIAVRLKREGIPFVEYYGTGMSAAKKAEVDARFRDTTRPCVFLCTGAAERGINLQHCHNLIVIDFKYNPVRLLQLFGRVDRIGQKHDVSIYYIVAKDTHEVKIFEKLFARQSLIDRVMDSDNAAVFNLKGIFEEVLRTI